MEWRDISNSSPGAMDSVYRKVDLARSLRISSLLVVVDSLLVVEDAILVMFGLVMRRLVEEEVIGG